MHARIENGSVVDYPIINLRQWLPNTSLPEDLSDNTRLPTGYVYVLEAPVPTYDRATHKVVATPPGWNGSAWMTGWSVVPLSPGEIAEAEADLARNARAQRNALLAESDYTQLLDYPAQNRAQWASYRQQLRDVPQQAGFPRNPQWPAKPV